MIRLLADRLANRLGYERKRPRIPGTLVFTSKTGSWRKDGRWDGDAPQ